MYVKINFKHKLRVNNYYLTNKVSYKGLYKHIKLLLSQK